MEKKEAQIIFSRYLKGDSIIQLKDGSILLYYFRKKYSIYILNEKTLKPLFKIDLSIFIDEYEEKIVEKDEPLKIRKYKEDEDYNYRLNCNSIKELDDGSFLIGRDNYLLQLILKNNIYDCKVVKTLDDIILDINELSEKRIIIFTMEKIVLLNKENEEYIIKNEYSIKNNWKITSMCSTHRFFGDFNQYYSSYVLPNDRLLLNSFSTEKSYNGGCGTHPPLEFSLSKIIFIDTKNFEEITSTENFKIDAKHIILEKVIIIQAYNHIIFYDINSLQIIKEISLDKSKNYMYQFDNKYIIALSKYEDNNKLLVYKIDNNDLVEYCEIKANLLFEKIYGRNNYTITTYNNKFLFTLKDKRVIITCHDKLYILKLELK